LRTCAALRHCDRAVRRGGLELPLPGSAQPRVAAAAGESAEVYPRHRLEGASPVVCALSQAHPGRQTGQCCHHCDAC